MNPATPTNPGPPAPPTVHPAERPPNGPATVTAPLVILQARVGPSVTHTPPAVPVPPAPTSPRLDNIHAYLMLSKSWMAPQGFGPDALRYACLQRNHEAQALTVPLGGNFSQEDGEHLVGKIADLEGRPPKDVFADLGRLRSLQAVRAGPFDDLRENGMDAAFGLKIKSIILQTPTFVVYLDENLSVVWNNSEDYGEFPSEFGRVMNRYAMLEAQPIEFLSRSVQEKYRGLLAQGVARLLDDKAGENALAIFDVAAGYLRDRSNEQARRTYLSAGLILVPLAIVCAFALWLNRSVLDAAMLPGFTIAAMAGCSGAAGAFLSVYYRITDLDIDGSGGKLGLVSEGAVRILVGTAAGIVLGWAVRANFLLGFLKGLVDGPGTTLLLGALAGASERFVPMLVTTFDQRASGSRPAEQGPAATAPVSQTPGT